MSSIINTEPDHLIQLSRSTTLKRANQINAITQLKDSRLAIGTFQKTIDIYNIYTLKLIRSIEAHVGAVNALKQLTDGRLISCGQDKIIKVWNTITFYCIKSIKTNNSIGSITQLQDNRVAFSRYDIEIRDALSLDLLIIIEAHSFDITSLIQLKNGKVVSSCKNDHLTKIWSIYKMTSHTTCNLYKTTPYLSFIQLKNGKLVYWHKDHLAFTNEKFEVSENISVPYHGIILLELKNEKILFSDYECCSIYDTHNLDCLLSLKIDLLHWIPLVSYLNNGQILLSFNTIGINILQLWDLIIL